MKQTRWARLLFTAAGVLGALLSAGAVAADLATTMETSAAAGSVTRVEIWQAVAADLRLRGLAERQLPRLADIDLPATIAARRGHSVHVSSACWDARSRRTQFRLECGEPGQCLPFVVYWREREVELDDETAAVRARAGSCGLSAVPRRRDAATQARSGETAMVREGDHATAVLLSGKLRMTSSVICLERGGAGEIIRVRGGSGQVFRARISGPGLLEAQPW